MCSRAQGSNNRTIEKKIYNKSIKLVLFDNIMEAVNFPDF